MGLNYGAAHILKPRSSWIVLLRSYLVGSEGLVKLQLYLMVVDRSWLLMRRLCKLYAARFESDPAPLWKGCLGV